MATINLNVSSKNGESSAITGTFASMSEGKLRFTAVTLGDATTVANTFPGYVDSASATAMNIPASHIISVV